MEIGISLLYPSFSCRLPCFATSLRLRVRKFLLQKKGGQVICFISAGVTIGTCKGGEKNKANTHQYLSLLPPPPFLQQLSCCCRFANISNLQIHSATTKMNLANKVASLQARKRKHGSPLLRSLCRLFGDCCVRLGSDKSLSKHPVITYAVRRKLIKLRESGPLDQIIKGNEREGQ